MIVTDWWFVVDVQARLEYARLGSRVEGRTQPRWALKDVRRADSPEDLWSAKYDIAFFRCMPGKKSNRLPRLTEKDEEFMVSEPHTIVTTPPTYLTEKKEILVTGIMEKEGNLTHVMYGTVPTEAIEESYLVNGHKPYWTKKFNEMLTPRESRKEINFQVIRMHHGTSSKTRPGKQVE